MKLFLMPRNKLSKWSLNLIICFFLFLGLFFAFALSGERGGANFFSNLKLALPAVLAAFSGISAFFTGFISIIKNKDYSISVITTSLMGLFVLLYVLGEIFCVH